VRGMAAMRTGRWMARREGPFAVFVFGMRLNRARGLRRFLWGLRVLRRVLADLHTGSARGFLAGSVYRTGRSVIAVQYWDSFDALDEYARDHALPHRGAWQRYLREALDDPAVGLWHETYLASPGTWEAVYVNMPPRGLGAAGELEAMQANKGSARDRLRQLRRRTANPQPPREPGRGPAGHLGNDR
jgi:hypothetical protein